MTPRDTLAALREWLLHPDRSYTPHELAMEAVRRIDAIALAPSPDAPGLDVEHASEAHYAQAVNCGDESCPLNWARLTREHAK